MLFFCLFHCFAEKEYQTESKRNETFGGVIFGTNVIQGTWSGRQERSEEATRQGGAPAPLGAPPPSRTPCSSTDLLLPPIYVQEHHETLFPPPQPSIPKRSHLGAFSGAPPEWESITEGFYINTIDSPMMCEYFTTDPRVHSY